MEIAGFAKMRLEAFLIMPHSICMYSFAFVVNASSPFGLYTSLTQPPWGSRPLNSSSSLLTVTPPSAEQ
jgi:hypothetical protein